MTGHAISFSIGAARRRRSRRHRGLVPSGQCPRTTPSGASRQRRWLDEPRRPMCCFRHGRGATRGVAPCAGAQLRVNHRRPGSAEAMPSASSSLTPAVYKANIRLSEEPALSDACQKHGSRGRLPQAGLPRWSIRSRAAFPIEGHHTGRRRVPAQTGSTGLLLFSSGGAYRKAVLAARRRLRWATLPATWEQIRDGWSPINQHTSHQDRLV
jgi:hypothetical protein